MSMHLPSAIVLLTCRDRAAERRKGLSADFEGVPDDLVGLLEGKVPIACLPPAGGFWHCLLLPAQFYSSQKFICSFMVAAAA